MGLISFLSEKLANGKKSRVNTSIYDFSARSLNGEPISFSQYRGRTLLIVNTASNCGYTPQYAELEKLHRTYQDSVIVLGFPANNFLWQEPGSNEEIASFCELRYNVSFQMFEKISVKGRDMHPLYRWLEAKTGKSPSWNFCKYVVDKNGETVTYFPSKVNPLHKDILDVIQG